MYSNNVQQFSAGYDLVPLQITTARITETYINESYVEDMRYWATGTAEPVSDSTVYTRLPEMTGHLSATTTTDVEFDEIVIPEATARSMELEHGSEANFLIARPDHAEQLERFSR